MFLAVLFVIVLIILIIICFKKGLRFDQKEPRAYYGGDNHDNAYTGRYDSKLSPACTAIFTFLIPFLALYYWDCRMLPGEFVTSCVSIIMISAFY